MLSETPQTGPPPYIKLITMKKGSLTGNFGERKSSVGPSVRSYTIQYNRRDKRWRLKKGARAVFSSKNKEDVEWWYTEVIKKNCVIF